MTNHRFSLRLDYEGGVAGRGNLASNGLSVPISVPRELGGAGLGTNPEELLLGAAASCYAITLSAILSRRELPVARVDLESDCFVDGTKGALVVTRIVHRPTLVFRAEPSAEARAAAIETTKVAERACMVSAALRGNVEVDVDTQVSVQ